jgi:hypothetical protein
MVICTFCGNDMIHGTTCSEEPLRIGGVQYEPIRWGQEKGYRFRYMTERCGDCNVPKGAVHHHGCDLEQCPACYSQAISCGCMDDCEPSRPNKNMNKDMDTNRNTNVDKTARTA